MKIEYFQIKRIGLNVFDFLQELSLNLKQNLIVALVDYLKLMVEMSLFGVEIDMMHQNGAFWCNNWIAVLEFVDGSVSFLSLPLTLYPISLSKLNSLTIHCVTIFRLSQNQNQIYFINYWVI
ncbi:hypothetical protein J6590_101683 [Homalodisca vitripennis]|nr:hypothetical protein J6590_101683 [Homalodisca vitripennis]